MTIKPVTGIDSRDGEILPMTDAVRGILLDLARKVGDAEDMRLISQCTHYRLTTQSDGRLNVQFGLPQLKV